MPEIVTRVTFFWSKLITFEVKNIFWDGWSLSKISFSPKPTQQTKVRRSQSLAHSVYNNNKKGESMKQQDNSLQSEKEW